jgi:hypothetical protein
MAGMPSFGGPPEKISLNSIELFEKSVFVHSDIQARAGSSAITVPAKQIKASSKQWRMAASRVKPSYRVARETSFTIVSSDCWHRDRCAPFATHLRKPTLTGAAKVF